MVNLLDCSVMYTLGTTIHFPCGEPLSYFDSSPLVDADTDTLILSWRKNGILLSDPSEHTIRPGSRHSIHQSGSYCKMALLWKTVPALRPTGLAWRTVQLYMAGYLLSRTMGQSDVSGSEYASACLAQDTLDDPTPLLCCP